jgi:GAF domain-containing protein
MRLVKPWFTMQESKTRPSNSTDLYGAETMDALRHLSRVGAAVGQIRPGDRSAVKATLALIAESAAALVPGTSVVIYATETLEASEASPAGDVPPAADANCCAFDSELRASAGPHPLPLPGEAPRPDGLGMRAIGQRRPVFSEQEPDLALHPVQVAAGARAAACFPLVVADQDVGLMYVYRYGSHRSGAPVTGAPVTGAPVTREGSFAPQERLALEALSHQAATALFRARQPAQVRRKEDELNRLHRAGLLISSRLGLEETLKAILQMALEVTNAHYGIFRLVDKSGRNLVTRAIAGEQLDRPLVEALPIDRHSVMGWVAEHRQAACIRDLRAAPWSGIYYPLDADLEMRAELAVPLIGASGRLEGVLNLESPAVGAFSEQDSHLLQSLATQAVIAIQEVRLLDALQEVAQLVLAEPCDRVLARLVELAGDLLNAAASAIWTLQGEELILQVASAGYRHGTRLPLHDSLTGQAVLSGGPVTSNDLRTDPRFHRADLARAQDWTRALIVPLLAAEPNHPRDVDQPRGARQPIGAFSVYSVSSEPGRFAESEWDAKVLTCLAHYAALAVHSAARQEALRAAQERHAVAETFAAVGDIAANLLHQLNNKVGAIPVRVQGIQDKCQPALLADLYLVANLDEIERSAREAMELVRENLAHLYPIHLAPVDVAACASAAIHSTSLPAEVQVQVDGLEGLPAVVAGQRSLTMVFANLLENAAEAMKGQGVIAISGAVLDVGAAGGRQVQIEVHDTGPGIPPELHDRIFEFNVSGQRASRANKLGFGLWWVKTLMVRLGGSVVVESDGQHGTTFRLSLPCVEEEP